MPGQFRKLRGAVILSGVLLCVLATMAVAAEPGAAPGGRPILMWGMYQDCTLDRAATDAVTLRLQQMGESVTPITADRPAPECSGSDCVRRLRATDGKAPRGRLLGGRWRRGADGETYVRLWLTNLAGGETTYADGSCAGCEVGELLARQAANLSERDVAAGVGSAAASSGERGAVASPASDGGGRKRIGMAISSKGGSLSTMMLISAAASKTLRQMGYEVVAAKGMGQGTPSKDLALLDITVAHDKSAGSSSIIMRHLVPGGAETSLNLDCGALNCQAGQIERLARQNIGILLDTATPERAPAVANLVPAARPRSPLEDPIDCRPPAESLTSGNPPPSPAGTATHLRYRPFFQPRRIVGLALIGASIVGFGISGWLVGQNGQLTGEQNCSFGFLPNQPCKLNTSAAFGIGFALSGVGLISGAMLVALPSKNEN